MCDPGYREPELVMQEHGNKTAGSQREEGEALLDPGPLLQLKTEDHGDSPPEEGRGRSGVELHGVHGKG